MTVADTPTAPPRRGFLAVGWLRFALAVTFLTRLPLPVRGEVTPADLRASMAWYVPIGAALGAFGWLVFRLSFRYLDGDSRDLNLLPAVLVMVLLEMATGALHLDGFMDTCDGLGSGAPRERALEIMKDSRVGAMGVFGAVAILLLKVSALATLDLDFVLPALVIGWTTARAVPTLDVSLFPYARNTGTGKAFAEGGSPWPAIIGVVIALAAGYFLLRLPGLILTAAVLTAVLLVQWRIARKLGGLTGDVYGMGIELAEALALIGALFLSRF